MDCKHSKGRKARCALISLGLVALVVGLVLALGACRGHHGRWATPERIDKMVTWHVDDLLDDVDATESQRKQVYGLKDRLLTEGHALRAKGEGAHRGLVEAWGAAVPDTTRMHAIVDERVEAFRAFAHSAVDASAELHGVLTPEQREVLLAKVREHLDEH